MSEDRKMIVIEAIIHTLRNKRNRLMSLAKQVCVTNCPAMDRWLIREMKKLDKYINRDTSELKQLLDF